MGVVKNASMVGGCVRLGVLIIGELMVNNGYLMGTQSRLPRFYFEVSFNQFVMFEGLNRIAGSMRHIGDTG